MSGLIAGAGVVVAHDDPAPGLKRFDPLGHRLRDDVAIRHHQHAKAVEAAGGNRLVENDLGLEVGVEQHVIRVARPGARQPE